MTDAPPASKKKKTASIVWSIVMVTFILLFFAALVGPKFAGFRRRADAARARQVNHDAGAPSVDGGAP